MAEHPEWATLRKLAQQIRRGNVAARVLFYAELERLGLQHLDGVIEQLAERRTRTFFRTVWAGFQYKARKHLATAAGERWEWHEEMAGGHVPPPDDDGMTFEDEIPF